MQQAEKLERGLGLAEATALNITFMVGIGPFVVIPFVVQAVGGPQSLLAWVLGALLALFDGCVWAELGAAMPQAGGSYIFLREAYGPRTWGRLISFLFIWQTLFQAPLSIASGALGFAKYSGYFVQRFAWATPSLMRPGGPIEKVIAATAVALAVLLLYRRIVTVGKISIALCVVVIGAILWFISGGIPHFHSGLLWNIPRGSWALSPLLLVGGLGHATVQTVYSYLGYYNVSNLGGEMKQPARNIPRAIFLSIIVISVLYFALQSSILSVVPWREAARTNAVVSLFVERTFGRGWASVATALILVTAFGSIFSATLGYSRVPYAAALDGNFFSIFARLHPTKRFPNVSLLALGATALIFCLSLSLIDVIRAILAMRCIIQFIGQAVGLMILHRRWRSELFPFKMWFYPLPVIVVILGWMGIFVSTGRTPMLASICAMLIGTLIYLIRARWLRQWPFEDAALCNVVERGGASS